MYVFVKFVCKNVFLNVCTTCTKIENVCILPRFLPFLFYLSRLETNNNLFSALQPVTGELTPVTTTQLKSYDDDEDQYKAAHAVDKDLSTVSVAETKNGETWLKLEFERNYFIHTITIYHQFYTNWYDPAHPCVQSYSKYRGCKDTDDNVDIAVYQGDEKQGDCGTLQLTYGLEQADQIYSFTCSAVGDTVLLSKTTGNIAVFEIVTTGRG